MTAGRRSRAVTALVVGLVLAFAPSAAATPGPQNAPEYWFDSWHVSSLWDQGADGRGVVIAEIDTGVNAALPELQGRVLSGTDLGAGGNGHIDRQVNSFGHGTAMASIMVGGAGLLGITGLAPAAKVLPIAVPLSGTTDSTGDDHLAQAIRYAADHHGKIISMSLGGARLPDRDTVPCPADEQEAIYYAMSKGSVVVAASGNTGPTTNTVEEPGVCLGVVSVGAVDITGAVASFSARHPYLTLTAPGVNIPSLSRTAGSAYSGDGTSQATAIASAVFALVWSAHPQLNARQITARILATLDQRTSTPGPAYGYGILNAYNAVTADVPTSAPNPVFAAADPFLARFRAFSRAGAPKPPKPAATGLTSVGRYEVGHAPRIFVPQVMHGIYLAVAGLVGLLALAVAGAFIRRSQRRNDGTVTVADLVGAQPPADQSRAVHTSAVQTPVDEPPTGEPAEDGNVLWHNILDGHGDAG